MTNIIIQRPPFVYSFYHVLFGTVMNNKRALLMLNHIQANTVKFSCLKVCSHVMNAHDAHDDERRETIASWRAND